MADGVSSNKPDLTPVLKAQKEWVVQGISCRNTSGAWLWRKFTALSLALQNIPKLVPAGHTFAFPPLRILRTFRLVCSILDRRSRVMPCAHVDEVRCKQTDFVHLLIYYCLNMLKLFWPFARQCTAKVQRDGEYMHELLQRVWCCFDHFSKSLLPNRFAMERRSWT